MYGLFHIHDQPWGGALLPAGEVHLARHTGIVRFPEVRRRSWLPGVPAITVDRSLRAQFWRLALPALGLFWTGVIWVLAA